MDTLTFNSPLLLRHLTFSEAKKTPISEINLKVALEELDMNMDQVSATFQGSMRERTAKEILTRQIKIKIKTQFIELCVLLGCDYLEPAKGIGPKTALKLMREHGSLANVVDFIRGKMAERQEAADEIEDQQDEKPTSVVASDDGISDIDVESEDGYEKPDVDDGDVDKDGDRDGKSASAGPSSSPIKKKTIEIKPASQPQPPTKRKKAIGGMQLPEYWPWEQAKEIFLRPDVLPADQVEVGV